MFNICKALANDFGTDWYRYIKVGTDAFQQIQPTGSMEDSMNCLKDAMLSVGALPGETQDDFGVFGVKEGSKQVQLHMERTV